MKAYWPLPLKGSYISTLKPQIEKCIQSQECHCPRKVLHPNLKNYVMNYFFIPWLADVLMQKSYGKLMYMHKSGLGQQSF